jgi:GAF domain-containing protein
MLECGCIIAPPARKSAQIVLQLASGRCVSSELENARSKGLKQRRLTGLLYLENTLTSSAFTPDRTAVLELLAAQAAISLENTRLYSDLQETGGEGPAPGRR